MALSDIVAVTITTTNPGVTRAGFGVPLIVSHSASWAERTRTYSGLTEVAADFTAVTPEYLAAASVFSQSPAPEQIMIGRCANAPTQRFAIGVNSATVGAIYKVTISGPNSTAWTDQDASYTAVAAAAWVLSTAYTTGQLVTNDTGKLYICTAAGTSAGSGGPTGTSASITDGGVTWMYAGAGAAGVTCNDAIVYNLKKAVDALAAPALSGVGAHQFTTSLQGSVGSKTLRILANTAGDFYGVSMSATMMALLSLAQDHADPGIATDLTAIALASSAWYGLITTFNSKALIEAAAAWAESNSKLYVPSTCDTACATVAESGGATDVGHDLKASAYARTGAMFHPVNDEFADAAEMGRFFPIDPGGDNWRLKTLAGVTVQTYTSTQITNLEARYMNYYHLLGGTNVIGGKGKVSANEYIDVIRFRDWYVAELQADLVDLLIQNEKIPFTDAGIALVEAIVRARNTAGIKAGGIASSPAPTVTVPKAADVLAADKAARLLPDVNSTWTLAGAINKLEVSVQVNT